MTGIVALIIGAIVYIKYRTTKAMIAFCLAYIAIGTAINLAEGARMDDLPLSIGILVILSVVTAFLSVGVALLKDRFGRLGGR